MNFITIQYYYFEINLDRKCQFMGSRGVLGEASLSSPILAFIPDTGEY